jgi:hypothetical protein
MNLEPNPDRAGQRRIWISQATVRERTTPHPRDPSASSDRHGTIPAPSVYRLTSEASHGLVYEREKPNG